MLQKLDEIYGSYKSGNYMAALALALTIPDICAQVEFPESNGVGKRYKKWFNTHLKQYYGEDGIFQAESGKTAFNSFNGKMTYSFNAEMCYELRCKVFHQGNDDISDKNQAYSFFIYATNIDITVPITITQAFVTNKIDNNTKQVIVLDLYQFCYWICEEAAKCYYANPSAFEEHTLTIVPIQIDSVEDTGNAIKKIMEKAFNALYDD